VPSKLVPVNVEEYICECGAVSRSDLKVQSAGSMVAGNQVIFTRYGMFVGR